MASPGTDTGLDTGVAGKHGETVSVPGGSFPAEGLDDSAEETESDATVTEGQASGGKGHTSEETVTERQESDGGAVTEGQASEETGDKGQTPEGKNREYGPTRPGDSLGRIVRAVDPDGRHDLFQLMWGIFLRNPQAFAENNINLLKTGVTIIIPYNDELARIDPDTARRDIQGQVERHRRKLAEKEKVTSQNIDTARNKAKHLEQENKDLSKRLSNTEQRIQRLLEENRIKSERIQELYDKADKKP